MPTPPSGSVPVGNPQTGYAVKSSDLATVKIEGLDKLNPDDDMKTMVAKLQKLKPTVVGNAYRLNRILGEINARIGVGGGGGGSSTIVQVGGGGSGGIVVQTGFWSVSGIFLFPTAVTTTAVLNGLTSSDAAGAGSIFCTGFMGVTSSAANATTTFIGNNGLIEGFLTAGSTGTGTQLPLSFYVKNSTRVATFTLGGQLFVGLFTTDLGVSNPDIIATGAITSISASTNASYIRIYNVGGNSTIDSGKSGTGTFKPLAFLTSGAEVARIRVGGSWLFGLTSSDVGDTLGWIVEQGVFGIVNAATNANALFLSVNGTTETVVHSSFSGAGTSLPLSFYVNGVRRGTFDTAGNLFVGALSISLPSSFFVGAGQNIWATDSIGVSTSSTNASTIFMSTSPSEVVLASHITGTGTQIPMSFYTGGARHVTIDPNGQCMAGFFTAADFPSVGRFLASTDVVVATAGTNASFIRFIFTGGTGAIQSGTTGTGTLQPIGFFLGGTEVGRWDATSSALFVGLTSTDIAPTSGMVLVKNAIWLVSNTTNASTFELHMGSLIEIISSSSGTGTILPIRFNFGGTEVARILTNGHHLLGLASTDAASGIGDLYISSIFGILSATTNANALFLSINGTTETVIHSSFSGTGTTLPLSIYTGGVRRATFTTAGGFIVGELSSDFFTGHCLVGDAASGMGLISAATNADVLLIRETSNLMQIDSSHSGTGTTRPLQFAMTESEIARFTTAGAFLVGISSTDFANQSGQITVNGFVSVVSAATNATTIDFHINGTTETLMSSSKTGTGTFLPLSFYTNNVRAWTIDTGTVLIGGNVSNGSYGAITGRILTKGDVIITTGFTGNESFVRMEIASSLATIETGILGTGTQLPLTFNVAVGNEKARFKTTGDFLVGLTSSDAAAGNGNIYISNFFGIVSATVNARALFMSINGTTETVVHSSFTGTNASLPLSLYVNAVRCMTVAVGGTVLVGALTSDWAGGTGRLVCFSDFVVSLGTVNTSVIRLGITGAGGETFVQSTISGTGTQLPLSFFIGGSRICQVTSGGFAVTGNLTVNGTVMTVP